MKKAREHFPLANTAAYRRKRLYAFFVNLRRTVVASVKSTLPKRTTLAGSGTAPTGVNEASPLRLAGPTPFKVINSDSEYGPVTPATLPTSA
jgi:hypothetical protein